MEQSPSSEANIHSSSQEHPVFMEPEISLPCSQQPATGPCPKMHPVHTVLPYFPEINSNTFYAVLISVMLVPCPARLILLDLITLTISVEMYKVLSSSLGKILQLLAPSSLSGPITFFCILQPSQFSMIPF